MEVNITEFDRLVYDKLFEIATNGGESLGPGEAVMFLRRSGLEDIVLHQVWEIADSNAEGILNQQGFDVAIKLIAACQADLNVEPASLAKETAIPQFGDVTETAVAWAKEQEAKQKTKTSPAQEANGSAAANWDVTPQQQAQFEKIFNGLPREADGTISGPTARGVLLNSKLPNQTLGAIWELSDMNKDGKLDKDEFAVAMYLVYQAMDGKPMPQTLPQSLIPPSKRDPSSETQAPIPQAVTHLQTSSASSQPPAKPASTQEHPPSQPSKSKSKPASTRWVVSKSEREAYKKFFTSSDKDNDGKVSGREVMGIFMSSNLPRDVLAHVWNLVDVDASGFLDEEQFYLAMHIIGKKVKGTDVPQELTAIMIPPSRRTPEQHAEVNAQVSSTKGDASDIDKQIKEAKSQLSTQQQTIKNLKAEKAATNLEAKAKAEELASLRKQIQDLKMEETQLRQEIRAGKDKIKKLVDQIKQNKGDATRVDGTVQRLKQSNAKINKALGQYSNAGQFVKQTSNKRSSVTSSSSINSRGDPFATTPTRTQQSSTSSFDPFASSPSGNSPWK